MVLNCQIPVDVCVKVAELGARSCFGPVCVPCALSSSKAWCSGQRGGERSTVWVPIVLTVAAVVCAWWNAVLLVTNA